jgi:hypothetical protein
MKSAMTRTQTPRPTGAEQAARGQATPAEVPRSSHAGCEPPTVRRDPIATLEDRSRTRLPELVAIRCGRMLVQDFLALRDAAQSGRVAVQGAL